MLHCRKTWQGNPQPNQLHFGQEAHLLVPRAPYRLHKFSHPREMAWLHTMLNIPPDSWMPDWPPCHLCDSLGSNEYLEWTRTPTRWRRQKIHFYLSIDSRMDQVCLISKRKQGMQFYFSVNFMQKWNTFLHFGLHTNHCTVSSKFTILGEISCIG